MGALLSIQVAAEMATVFGAFLALVALIINACATVISAGVSLRNQRISVTLHCNVRYDQLYQVRSAILDRADIRDGKVIDYYRRYWGLQSDQIDYWLDGYVDPDTMASWLSSMAGNLKEGAGRAVGKVSYLAGWDAVKKSHIGPNNALITIVTKMQEINAQEYLSDDDRFRRIVGVMQEMEILEKTFISQVSKNRLGRYRVKSFIKTLANDRRQQYMDLNPKRGGFRSRGLD